MSLFQAHSRRKAHNEIAKRKTLKKIVLRHHLPRT